MKTHSTCKRTQGQAAIEYTLLGMVISLALLAPYINAGDENEANTNVITFLMDNLRQEHESYLGKINEAR